MSRYRSGRVAGGWWVRLARFVAVVLGLAALGAAAGPTALADAYRVMIGRVDSSKFPEVRFNVTILDHQFVPVSGLTAASFELQEDGKPVAVTGVAKVVDADNPIAIVLGIDSNASMDGRPLRETKEAVADFLFNLQPNDTVAAVSFGDQVRLLHRFSTDKPAVAARVREVRADGNSLLYDAMYESIELAGREPTPRRVIVFLSDGRDGGSRRSLNDVLGRATDTRVPFFGIGLGEDVNMDALRKVADATGGVAIHAPTSADVLGAYQTIANHLRAEYAVTFRSNLKADGSRHQLTVRPRLPDAKPSGQVPFVAVKNPPQIDLVTPQPGAELRDVEPVEVKITSFAAITRVEFTSAGRALATLEAPPWKFDWNTEDLKNGQHTLNITVYDSADNRVTRFVSLVVNNREKTPTRTLQASAPPVVTAGGERLELPIWLFAAIGAVPILFVTHRLGRWVYVTFVPLRCSTHRVHYRRGTVCPRCAAEAGTSIDSRLRRFAALGIDAPAEREPETAGTR